MLMHRLIKKIGIDIELMIVFDLELPDFSSK